MNDIIFLDSSAKQCIEVDLVMSAFVPSKYALQLALCAKTHHRQYTLESCNPEQTDEH